MQPEMIRTTYFEIDGPQGIDVVPLELIQGTFPETAKSDTPIPVPDALQPFCENTVCHSVTKRFGWCVRMQEPGYLDATPWVCIGTKREAIEYLLETYGQWDAEPENWQRDLERQLKRCK